MTSTPLNLVKPIARRQLPRFDNPSVDLVFVDPSGKGLYFVASTLVDSSLQGSKLWYASRDKESVTVCEGLWQFAGMEPVYGDHVVGVLALEDEQAVWLVGPENSRMLGGFDNSRSWMTILGYDENLLVVGNRDHSDGARTITVVVYRMYSEAKDGAR